MSSSTPTSSTPPTSAELEQLQGFTMAKYMEMHWRHRFQYLKARMELQSYLVKILRSRLPTQSSPHAPLMVPPSFPLPAPASNPLHVCPSAECSRLHATFPSPLGVPGREGDFRPASAHLREHVMARAGPPMTAGPTPGATRDAAQSSVVEASTTPAASGFRSTLCKNGSNNNISGGVGFGVDSILSLNGGMPGGRGVARGEMSGLRQASLVEAGAGNAPNRGPYEKVENNIGIRRVSDMKSAEGKTKKMYFCVTAGCSYKSDRRNNVKRHRESQHEKPPKEVKVCCGKSYRDNYEFKRHTREFHATGYACDFCPHVDTRRKGLERHLATHARNASALGPAAPLGHHYQRLEHFETRATDGGSGINRGQATPIDYSSSMSHLATPTSTMERASSPADAASDSSSSSASSEGGDERDTSEGGVVVMVADSSVNHNHNSQRGGDHLPA